MGEGSRRGGGARRGGCCGVAEDTEVREEAGGCRGAGGRRGRASKTMTSASEKFFSARFFYEGCKSTNKRKNEDDGVHVDGQQSIEMIYKIIYLFGVIFFPILSYFL